MREFLPDAFIKSITSRSGEDPKARSDSEIPV
jgi:hypothetical protein